MLFVSIFALRDWGRNVVIFFFSPLYFRIDYFFEDKIWKKFCYIDVSITKLLFFFFRISTSIVTSVSKSYRKGILVIRCMQIFNEIQTICDIEVFFFSLVIIHYECVLASHYCISIFNSYLLATMTYKLNTWFQQQTDKINTHMFLYLKNQLSRILIVKAELLFVLQTQLHNYESKRIKIRYKMSLELRETHNCPCMIFCKFLDAYFQCSSLLLSKQFSNFSKETLVIILPVNRIVFLVINEGKTNVFDEGKRVSLMYHFIVFTIPLVIADCLLDFLYLLTAPFIIFIHIHTRIYR